MLSRGTSGCRSTLGCESGSECSADGELACVHLAEPAELEAASSGSALHSGLSRLATAMESSRTSAGRYIVLSDLLVMRATERANVFEEIE